MTCPTRGDVGDKQKSGSQFEIYSYMYIYLNFFLALIHLFTEKRKMMKVIISFKDPRCP